jgi:dihydroorotase
MLLKNAKIFDGDRFLEGLRDVTLEEGKIRRIVPAGAGAEEVESVDLEGRILSPGFVDLHAHFRDPGQTWREDLTSGSLAAAAGGFVLAVAMPNTDPAVDTPELAEYVAGRGVFAPGARIVPAGCVSKRREGRELAELRKMARAGAVLFTDDGAPVGSSELLRLALLYADQAGLRIMEHPEEKSLSEKGQIHEGAVSALCGLKGIPGSSELLGVQRGIALARETGASIHLTHLSLASSVSAVRAAKAEGLRVTCDATPHHLIFCDEDVRDSGFDAAFKVNPPLRGVSDVEALWGALEEGTLDAVATDHAPWHEDEKDLPFPEAPFGIPSLECAVAALLDAWNRRGCPFPLERILRALTAGPRSILPETFSSGWKLAEGAPADLTVLDPERTKVVDLRTWKSKARISPYGGRMLRGWPVLTLREGRIVHRDEGGLPWEA